MTGLFCHYVLGFKLLEGMLIVLLWVRRTMPASRIFCVQKIEFKYNTASLLELESGSNDPTAFTMTMVFLSAIIGTKLSVPVLILSQVVLGIVMVVFFHLLSGNC